MSIISLASLSLVIFIGPLLSSDGLAGEIATQFSADIISGAEINNLKDNSNINPENEVFHLYDQNLLLDLRPNLIFSKDDLVKATIRPRIEGHYGALNQEGGTGYEFKKDVWLNEGFLSLYPFDNFQMHMGRQSFLWGPSEVVGPSNPFYPDILNRPNPLFQLRGVTMARINYSLGNEYTLVGMAELKSLEDSEFEIRPWENEENLHHLLLKGEYASNDGDISVGVSFGQNKIKTSLLKETYSHFLGSYLMWTINPAIQVYGDLRIDLVQEKAWPYYVAGIRWTSQDGTEWRNEYIHKELGLDDSDRKVLKTSLTNPILQGPLTHALLLNQDNLLSEDYYYSSLRMNLDNLKSIDDPLFGLRFLYSLTSQSGIISSYLEGGISDNLTLVGYFAQSFGEDFGDFNSVVNSSGGLFIKLSL